MGGGDKRHSHGWSYSACTVRAVKPALSQLSLGFGFQIEKILKSIQMMG